MKKNGSKKIIVIASVIVFVVISIILFLFLGKKDDEVIVDDVEIKFEFYDDFIPGASYTVEIDNDTKILKIHEEHFCSALDCDTTYVYNEIELTNEEYVLIVKVWKKINDDYDGKTYFVSALSNIASNDNVMYDSSDPFYEKEYDLNNDGVITDREFGNVYLKNIDKEF